MERHPYLNRNGAEKNKTCLLCIFQFWQQTVNHPHQRVEIKFHILAKCFRAHHFKRFQIDTTGTVYKTINSFGQIQCCNIILQRIKRKVCYALWNIFTASRCDDHIMIFFQFCSNSSSNSIRTSY